LGGAHRTLEQLNRAIAHFRRLVELPSDTDDAQITLSACLHETCDVAGTIACYSAALRVDPNAGAAGHQSGLALLDSDDVDGAVAPLELGVELDPTNLVALNGLGAVYFRLGRAENAECINRASSRRVGASNVGVVEIYARLALDARP
jgi:Flp pilus assembly protein TadD